MSAPPILQMVYREHVEHFGEPDGSIVFDDSKPLDGYPDRIDVLYWLANTDCDITTFATIGMSSLSQPDKHYSAELHFAVRRECTEDETHSISRFLANVAMYPFQINTALDWWHTISNPSPIPLFPSAECLLMHPKFVKEGWDRIFNAQGDVKLLNVIPITREEKDLKTIELILDQLDQRDMFTPF